MEIIVVKVSIVIIELIEFWLRLRINFLGVVIWMMVVIVFLIINIFFNFCNFCIILFNKDKSFCLLGVRKRDFKFIFLLIVIWLLIFINWFLIGVVIDFCKSFIDFRGKDVLDWFKKNVFDCRRGEVFNFWEIKGFVLGNKWVVVGCKIGCIFFWKLNI